MDSEKTARLEKLVAQAQDAYDRLSLDEALQLYRQAEAIKADDLQVQWGLAQTLIRMRLQEEARQAAERCVALAPERFEGHLALGVLGFLTDELDDARAHLERAAACAPDNPEPLLIMAQVLADQSKFEEADQQLAQARELIAALEPGKQRESLEALAWHVETYLRLSEGKTAEAMEAAQEVIARQEANPYAASLAYSNLGVLHVRTRQYDQAIEYLEKACQMNPHFYRAKGALGRVLILRGQYARAAEMLREVVENLPDPSGETYYAYGMALAKTGHRHEAREQYRHALQQGLSGINALMARWQTIWLSDTARYVIPAIVLAVLLIWIIWAKPSAQSLTLLAVFVVIFILQRAFGKKR